jgi:hypothetical protein
VFPNIANTPRQHASDSEKPFPPPPTQLPEHPRLRRTSPSKTVSKTFLANHSPTVLHARRTLLTPPRTLCSHPSASEDLVSSKGGEDVTVPCSSLVLFSFLSVPLHSSLFFSFFSAAPTRASQTCTSFPSRAPPFPFGQPLLVSCVLPEAYTVVVRSFIRSFFVRSALRVASTLSQWFRVPVRPPSRRSVVRPSHAP